MGNRAYFLKLGLVRDLNPGPLAPEARIIPLDQRAENVIWVEEYFFSPKNSHLFRKSLLPWTKGVCKLCKLF